MEGRENIWRDELLRQQRDIEKMRQSINQTLLTSEQMVSDIQSSFSQLAQAQSVAAQLARQMRVDLLPTESVLPSYAQLSKQMKAESSLKELMTSQLAKQINTVCPLPPQSLVADIAKQMRMISPLPPQSLVADIAKQMRMISPLPPQSLVADIAKQMRMISPLPPQSLVADIAKQMRVVDPVLALSKLTDTALMKLMADVTGSSTLRMPDSIMGSLITDSSNLLDELDELEEEPIVIIYDGIDKTKLNLIENYFSNETNNNRQKSFIENLPIWACILSEEYRRHLIDFRKAWYEGKPLNWYTHLQVDFLTLQFLIDFLWSHISYQRDKLFRPVRRPRL